MNIDYNKVKVLEVDNINHYDYPEYSDDIERFSALSNWVLERIRWFNNRVQKVYLEDTQ